MQRAAPRILSSQLLSASLSPAIPLRISSTTTASRALDGSYRWIYEMVCEYFVLGSFSSNSHVRFWQPLIWVQFAEEYPLQPKDCAS